MMTIQDSWWQPNPEHMTILMKGVEAWNHWRLLNPNILPDLKTAKLDGWDLRRADLANVNFGRASLVNADLSETRLYQAEFFEADLRGANLRAADLRGAKFHDANLKEANLEQADLFRVDFIGTALHKARFSKAICWITAFSNVDLSEAIGLEKLFHQGPSSVDVSTLLISGNTLPNAFLRGIGLPDSFIQYLPSIMSARQPIQFYSCFISYSHKDEEFAERLYSRMRDAHLRVWYAPEDIRAGLKLHEQIDRAIHLHDRLLIVLSENSLPSQWVMTEIRKARRIENKEKIRKLFPIRLTNFETLQDWECFDADSGKDLAVEIREYFIPDFSNWRDDNAFEMAFERLWRDLKAED